jgi:murein DD-endopeptidase MepM/ murein hydrolase activator NlpD
MSFYRFSILTLILVLSLVSCTSAPVSPTPGQTEPATGSPPATYTPSFTPTLVPATQTPLSPTDTPAPKAQLCSPLDGLTLAQLPQILVQPFIKPSPGKDDGHTGVDFSYWTRGKRTSMVDLPVYSALPGKVAAVLPNRLPYGNAIIIETPLDRLPSGWLDTLQVPAQVPTVAPAPVMMCTLPAQPANWEVNKRSLYILYAHFYQAPIAKAGDNLKCGQQIGGVGTTGMSSNDHLHFEVRVGPSGASFGTMAYYDTTESPAEISTYCEWRISQVFELIDPMKLLTLQP